MPTHRPRPSIDLSSLTPGTLDQLPDEEFRMVVDADVKRASASMQRVPEWVSRELRTTVVDRWYSTLKRMHASVDHQLETKAAEFEGEQARLGLLDETGTKVEELKVRHFQKRTQSLRFKSGLTDVLLEAEGLVNARAARLQEAIRAHREALLADDQTEPSDADETLWKNLN